jgi:hypothetical protein
MLGHIRPGLLRVPGEAQFIHDYIVATRGRSVKLPEGSSPQWQIGGCPLLPHNHAPSLALRLCVFARNEFYRRFQVETKKCWLTPWLE